MANQQLSELAKQGLLPSFGPDFLEDHAGRRVTQPEIALVELVANCWDAGADRVEITWPTSAAPELVAIKDNGTGMTYDQFIHRWLQLNYNRREMQGEDVEFPPDNQSSPRKAFGRNGKGRHSMFCFASGYSVETWRDGQANMFKVRRTPSLTEAPYTIEPVDQFTKEGHGTIVLTELARNYLKVSEVRDLIGSKFVTDPAFRVYVNGELIELTSLQHLLDRQEIAVRGVGTVLVSQVDTQRTSRTSHPHGIAWWVHKRLVGEPSWEDLGDTSFLDRRTIEARRYTFVVEADVLVDELEDDWSGFRDTKSFRAVRGAVGSHVRQRLAELMKDVHKERKRAALRANLPSLTGLSPDSRYYVGRTLDGIQEMIPSVTERVLSAMVSVLSNLEKARTGYALLEQLASLQPHELDELSEILDKWTVQEARIVLSELDRRLKLIKRLEQLVEDPSSDELHDIQPLFARGLWIFGPEYESIHFTSNQTLSTVIRKLFGDGLEEPLVNARRRPDFVVLPDSTVGIYASDAFDQRSEVSGFDKVLIVELKKGGSKITVEGRRQGEDYARALQQSGKVQRSTEIVVFVLGTEVAEDLRDEIKEGNTTVYARSYSVVLRQAHARTFHLQEKIREVKQEELLDLDVEEVLMTPSQIELFPN